MPKNNYYRRETYLSKVRPFLEDTGIIKVITGIRRCGKSCFMRTIAAELEDAGVNPTRIVLVDLEQRGLRGVRTPDTLEAAIESRVPNEVNETIYLFIDEIQRVHGFEEVVNAYRADGHFSVFITGSNSYLLSGELMTNLTGRYIEIEMFTLTFDEYLGMREFLDKPSQSDTETFREFLRYGGFPKALEYDDPAAKSRYIQDVVGQIFDKDIRSRVKIRNREMFERVTTYIINNFASPTNLVGIANYITNVHGTPLKRQTLARYIQALVDAKVLYRCNRFDMKSRRSLQGGEKYYLADTGIHFARNTDATMNYGPLLENIAYTYLRSKDYAVSVGSIGKLEVDFITRGTDSGYSYIQVSMTVADPSVEEREYRPFQAVRDNYPQYLLTLDPLPLERDGVTHLNMMELMAKGGDLSV